MIVSRTVKWLFIMNDWFGILFRICLTLLHNVESNGNIGNIQLPLNVNYNLLWMLNGNFNYLIDLKSVYSYSQLVLIRIRTLFYNFSIVYLFCGLIYHYDDCFTYRKNLI